MAKVVEQMNMQRFSLLFEGPDKLVLIACDERGNRIVSGSVLGITPDGIEIYSGLNQDVPIARGEQFAVRIKEGLY